MRVVVALGGNALLRRGGSTDAETQRRNVAAAARQIATLAAEHDVVVTHGNAPQVGLLALQAESAPGAAPYPLDVLDAESEGMIGYLVEQELENRLAGRSVATLLTQIVVEATDPAFANPAKPIGPVYDEATASALAREHGWSVAPDGPHWRRVVASPEPREIVELETIRGLVERGVIVICAGGGGIPVIRDRGRLHGVEAVIDKDASAALLAEGLGADALLLLTDVDALYRGWGTEYPTPIACATPTEVARLELAAGSMEPKAQAAARFVAHTGHIAAIGSLGDAAAVLAGRAGTTIVPTRLATVSPVRTPR